MTSSRATKRLRDAVAAAEMIATGVEGRTYDDYLADPWFRAGVERQLEIIGEALNQALRNDPDLSTTIPDAYVAIGLRNRIIHGYDDIQDAVVWDAAVNGVPLLRAQIEDALREEGSARDETGEG